MGSLIRRIFGNGEGFVVNKEFSFMPMTGGVAIRNIEELFLYSHGQQNDSSESYIALSNGDIITSALNNYHYYRIIGKYDSDKNITEIFPKTSLLGLPSLDKIIWQHLVNDEINIVDILSNYFHRVDFKNEYKVLGMKEISIAKTYQDLLRDTNNVILVNGELGQSSFYWGEITYPKRNHPLLREYVYEGEKLEYGITKNRTILSSKNFTISSDDIEYGLNERGDVILVSKDGKLENNKLKEYEAELVITFTNGETINITANSTKELHRQKKALENDGFIKDFKTGKKYSTRHVAYYVTRYN